MSLRTSDTEKNSFAHPMFIVIYCPYLIDIAAEPPLPAAEQTNGGEVLNTDARWHRSGTACFHKSKENKKEVKQI